MLVALYRVRCFLITCVHRFSRLLFLFLRTFTRSSLLFLFRRSFSFYLVRFSFVRPRSTRIRIVVSGLPRFTVLRNEEVASKRFENNRSP